MKLNNSKEIFEFKLAVSQCQGDVWLMDKYDNRFNLKSVMSQYIALGELLKDRGNELELFCQLPEDEAYFLKFFYDNPETL